MSDPVHVRPTAVPWEPMPLTELVARFAACPAPWWVAGGHAIELAVGRGFRTHGDIDVALLRRDQLAVQRVLAGWEWWAADPPGTLRPWRRGELLPTGVHDIWCRPGPDGPWRVQVMLDEAEGDTWISRRDPRIRRPLDRYGTTTADGIPYLRPEIQLFYKAKSPRDRDEDDLAEVLPHLGADARVWLDEALFAAYGPHPWCDVLRR